MIRRNYVCWVFLALFLSIATSPSEAAVPNTINYQGYLTDSDGEPVNSGQFITFRIYSQAIGGVELWSETLPVTIIDGAFTVVLGDGLTPFPNSLFDGPLYLGIAVGADSEMTPRKPITSAPFALNAERLDGRTIDDVAYTDGEAIAAQGALNNNNPLNHNRFTAGEARSAMGGQAAANPFNHNRYTNGEAVSAMGAKADSNPLHHDRYTDNESLAAMGAKTDSNPLHHDRYTDNESVAAMGAKADNNPLHHDRYTNGEAVAAIRANDGSGSNLDADLLDGMQASEIIAAASTPNPLGTPITSVPFTISESGNYYLPNDLSSDDVGIIISADNVTLDFNHRKLTITSTDNFDAGVRAIGDNAEIRNGTIQGVIGSSGPPAIVVASIIGIRIENMELLDTDGLEASSFSSGCFFNNNLIDGDTRISTTNPISTPTVLSEGIDGSRCRNSIVTNNIVQNTFDTFSGIRAIGIVKNNAIRNVVSANGVCLFISGLAVQNLTRDCTASGATDVGDINISTSGDIDNVSIP